MALQLTHDLAFLTDPSVWLRIFVSVLCGTAIGLEREMHGKPAGMRTTMLICVGATLYAMVGVEVGRNSVPQLDPLRVAAQIVTGVGFIGAGVIIHVGATVKGLTTAAAIWFTAAVGTVVGLGYPLSSLVVTVFIILVLVLLTRAEIAFFPATHKSDSNHNGRSAAE